MPQPTCSVEPSQRIVQLEFIRPRGTKPGSKVEYTTHCGHHNCRPAQLNSLSGSACNVRPRSRPFNERGGSTDTVLSAMHHCGNRRGALPPLVNATSSASSLTTRAILPPLKQRALKSAPATMQDTRRSKDVDMQVSPPNGVDEQSPWTIIHATLETCTHRQPNDILKNFSPPIRLGTRPRSEPDRLRGIVLAPLSTHTKPAPERGQTQMDGVAPGSLLAMPSELSTRNKVQLLYDSVLNCYFDPATSKYFEFR